MTNALREFRRDHSPRDHAGSCAFGVEREPAALVIEEVESGLGAMHRAYLA